MTNTPACNIAVVITVVKSFKLLALVNVIKTLSLYLVLGESKLECLSLASFLGYSNISRRGQEGTNIMGHH